MDVHNLTVDFVAHVCDWWFGCWHLHSHGEAAFTGGTCDMAFCGQL
jgi:hypothetical protein